MRWKYKIYDTDSYNEQVYDLAARYNDAMYDAEYLELIDAFTYY